ncbi:MAG: class I SAM-dependent methyltransferase [Planctomycetota bacterium]|jgi:2-polyprenyl-3-methyl-5-hydroxy-6-metoxy-1,4-benzoquinol methylase
MPEGELEHVSCTVCESDDPAEVLTAIAYRFGPSDRFRVVRCRACSTLYTNPRPAPDAVERYYDDGYYHDLDGGRPARGPPEMRERWIRRALREHFGYPGRKRGGLVSFLTLPVAWRLRHHRRHLDAIPWSGAGALLDFGCGGCGFLRLQRARGWEVLGIDFSETVARRARERDGLEVAVGSWPGEALADRRFDAITAWHAIEHLPDPSGWVRQAAHQLNPGGYLLLCCPNADSWAFRRFGAYWNQLDLPRHLTHFTAAGLERLVTGSGLTVERIRPQVRPANLRASARLRAKQTGSAVWGFLARRRLLWSAIATLTGWLGSSDGVLVLARKPQGQSPSTPRTSEDKRGEEHR